MPTTAKTKKPKILKKTENIIRAKKKLEKPEVTETEQLRPAKEGPLSQSPGEEGESRQEKKERYFEDVGRRKTAVARVRLFTKAGDFTINNKTYNSYFPNPEFQRIAEEALQKMKLFGRFKVSAKIKGGGLHAQAEALRHGLARCLVKFNPDFRKRLKRAGYLTRDSRMKERKKFGLKKARKAPQWAKR